jgi:hypothetical protein
MTKGILCFVAGISLGAASTFTGLFGLQAEGKQLESADLRKMVDNLGYTTKELGDPAKGKFEFKITKDTLDVPVAAELSASKRFIWLTAFLGDTTKSSSINTKALPLLQKNADIQPSMFYVTSKGNLMIGLCLENRDLTPAILRWRIDKIVGDVVSTEKVWSGD